MASTIVVTLIVLGALLVWLLTGLVVGLIVGGVAAIGDRKGRIGPPSRDMDIIRGSEPEITAPAGPV